MIDINNQPQPGDMVGFLSPLESLSSVGCYRHWVIIANTFGSDGKREVISVGKIGKAEGKVYKENFSDADKRLGYDIFPTENAREICQRAVSRIGEDWQYDLISNNCEHFVQEIAGCRRQSDQVRNAIIVTGIIGAVLIGKQRGLSGNMLSDAMIGGVVGIAVNDVLQQPGGTQMTHQPRV